MKFLIQIDDALKFKLARPCFFLVNNNIEFVFQNIIFFQQYYNINTSFYLYFVYQRFFF